MSVNNLDDYRRVSGAKAYHFGNLFESMFSAVCKKTGVTLTRMPDGCKVIGSNKIIRVKTPFDWILTYQGRSAFIDTKTVDAESFRHSSIQEHQIHEMIHHEIAGAYAGYVIWLRKSNWIVFVSALELGNLIKKKGSITQGQENVKAIGNSAFFDPRVIFPTVTRNPNDVA